MRARLVTGLFVIIVLLFVWSYHLAETRRLQNSLLPEAEALLQQYKGEDNAQHNQVTFNATAGRAVPLFGKVWGKVTVYTRTEDTTGKAVYRGIEHFYAYENGQWHLTESGGCAGPQCQIRAQEAFEGNAILRIEE